MDTKLKELTEKIYAEGVEKGRIEAENIVENAKAEAEKIIASAKAEAEEITAKARKEAADIDANTKSELRLYTQQTVNSIKSEIADLVTDRVVSHAVGNALKDVRFLQDVIREIAGNWAKEGSVVIEAEKAKELEEYFAANASELLKQGVKITSSRDGKTEYTISHEAAGFKVTMGEKELTEYFKEFVRPRLMEILF
ncbi:MAG: hypothetical protein MJZ95_03105 [Paludibacteraceae bacterium]|nr:hypothetical protein [Paludibacteraceae bacterium]